MFCKVSIVLSDRDCRDFLLVELLSVSTRSIFLSFCMSSLSPKPRWTSSCSLRTGFEGCLNSTLLLDFFRR
jgi:hypothetical protein